ncbi:MAG: DUF4347 domain-containing protein, partial [Gammaproteobacteria bacterium]|nr:DUF4347 domain-containing protein [Gammaproteobacteria bacterium]
MKNRKNRKAELPAVFEQLEPRLLFSAGLESALAADQPAAPTEIYKQTVLEQSLETGRAENRDTRVVETHVEIIFVDTDTPRYQSLLSDLLKYPDDTTSFEVFELDNTRDGIAQVTSVLDGYNNVNAIHILSHGSE